MVLRIQTGSDHLKPSKNLKYKYFRTIKNLEFVIKFGHAFLVK